MTREEAIARIIDHKIIHKMKEPRAIYISEALDLAIEALKLIPDNATNGDVIKALFPKWEQLNDNHVWLNSDLDDFTHIAYKPDWWNALYKKEALDEDSD